MRERRHAVPERWLAMPERWLAVPERWLAVPERWLAVPDTRYFYRHLHRVFFITVPRRLSPQSYFIYD